MKKRAVDEVVGVMMQFAPDPVTFVKVEEMDYRSSPKVIQVVDLWGR